MLKQHRRPRVIHQVTVTSKGQIRVPADIQRYLGLRRGDPVQIEIRDDEIVFTLQRSRLPPSALTKMRQ